MLGNSLTFYRLPEHSPAPEVVLRRFSNSVLFALGISLMSPAAFAEDSIDFSLIDVRFNSAGQLFLNGSDGAGWFWGLAAADGDACPAQSADVRKAWLSLAEAAILGGKKIHVVYQACASGHRAISELWLIN
jgi:ribosome modulation factor